MSAHLSNVETENLLASESDKSKVHELPYTKIYLSVQGMTGKTVSAVVQPQQLNEQEVSARVDWHGNDVGSVLVEAQGDRSLWFQRFMVLWLAAGPEMEALVPELTYKNWKVAKAVFPDIDGAAGDTVHLQLQKTSWDAKMVLTRDSGSLFQQEIPSALDDFTVGHLLGQMASLMLLKKPWLRFS